MQVFNKRVFVLNYRFRLPKLQMSKSLWLLFFEGAKMKKIIEPGVYKDFNPREEILKYEIDKIG